MLMIRETSSKVLKLLFSLSLSQIIYILILSGLITELHDLLDFPN